MITADVASSGPLFDGRAPAIMDAYTTHAERSVSSDGAQMVRRELDHVLKNPTGYYRAHIEVHRDRGDSVITDGGVIYGPWLEGVGERNRSTRFKGYATFRRVSFRLAAMSGVLAEKILPEYLRRLER